MDNNFEKKLDIIFERIETLILDNSESKFDVWIKRISAISSSVIAFLALIISVSTLSIYRNTYNITEEQFLLNTTENLTLSVGNNNVDIVDLKSGETEPELYCRTELSICINNKSNLPIYIVSANASRPEHGNAVQIFPTIDGLDLPISMQPQETKFLNCHMLIKIPDSINEFIVEKFPEPSDVDFDTITKYLFFEKCTDLIGNEVIIKEKGGTTYFTQHLSLPLSLELGTSKGNDFSTRFYMEGLNPPTDKEYMDELAEQYGSWGIHFSKEPIDKKEPLPLSFRILLDFNCFSVVFFIGLFCIHKIRKAKANQENSPAEEKTD